MIADRLLRPALVGVAKAAAAAAEPAPGGRVDTRPDGPAARPGRHAISDSSDGASDAERREEGRAGLFRRPRHLGHPALAAGLLSLRGGHLHRRSRPGRGAGARPRQGRAAWASSRSIIEDLQEEFVRDFVFPMFRANALYEGSYLLGTSIARPLIAKRLIEIAPRSRRRRRRPRRHRQGQRPGPLRAGLLRAQPAHQGDRPLARVGPGQPRQADRVRRGAADPDPARQARRGPLLDRRQPAAHLLRGQGARGPVGRARRGHVHPHRLARRRRPTRRPMSRSASSAATPVAVDGERCRRRSLLRRLNDLAGAERHRPSRPGREPLRRHEEPRRLRDPRRHRPAGGAPRRSRASRSTAVRRTSRTR